MIFRISLLLIALIAIHGGTSPSNEIDEIFKNDNFSNEDIVSAKTPDKFLEDLKRVQETYKRLKEKWAKIRDETEDRRTPPPNTTTNPPITVVDIEQIDVDLLDTARDTFTDISLQDPFANVSDISVDPRIENQKITPTVFEIIGANGIIEKAGRNLQKSVFVEMITQKSEPRYFSTPSPKPAKLVGDRGENHTHTIVVDVKNQVVPAESESEMKSAEEQEEEKEINEEIRRGILELQGESIEDITNTGIIKTFGQKNSERNNPIDQKLGNTNLAVFASQTNRNETYSGNPLETQKTVFGNVTDLELQKIGNTTLEVLNLNKEDLKLKSGSEEISNRVNKDQQIGLDPLETRKVEAENFGESNLNLTSDQEIGEMARGQLNVNNNNSEGLEKWKVREDQQIKLNPLETRNLQSILDLNQEAESGLEKMWPSFEIREDPDKDPLGSRNESKPSNILQPSVFISTGPDSQDGSQSNYFTYPQHIQIPFYGTRPISTMAVESGKPSRPTTPIPIAHKPNRLQANPPIINDLKTPTDHSPIGPHGLRNIEFTSVDMPLPAFGVSDYVTRGMERNRPAWKMLLDPREIESEMTRIADINQRVRNNYRTHCGLVYAQILTLPDIQRLSTSIGLSDVAKLIESASDVTMRIDDQLDSNLDHKRLVIARLETLLALSEARSLLFDLLDQQRKLMGIMEKEALEMLQKPPPPYTPPNISKEMSELSLMVKEATINGEKKQNRKKKSRGKSEKRKNLRTKPTSNLPETAEIVEPVLEIGSREMRVSDTVRPLKFEEQVSRRIPNSPPRLQKDRNDQWRFGNQFYPNRAQLSAPTHHARPRPLSPPHPPTDEEVESSSEKLIDMLHADINELRQRGPHLERRNPESFKKLSDQEQEEEICRQPMCSFEKGNLCNFESSHDEVTRIRNRRATIFTDLSSYTFRAWSIWAARHSANRKQIDISPDFGGLNTHFAAVFLEPSQAGILSTPLFLSGRPTKIRMRIYESTRGLRLRVCCDRFCPFETELGVYRGHRYWLKKTVMCPPNTQMLSLECINDGENEGACGVDEIFVDSPNCVQLFAGADDS